MLQLVGEFVRGSCTHFNRSAKRRDIYRKFQKLLDVPEHVFLSPGQTRWLSLEYAVSDESSKNRSFTGMLQRRKQEGSHSILWPREYSSRRSLYKSFLVHALNLFNDFNTTFQSEVPQVHTLKQNLYEVIRTCAKNFMEDSYEDQCDPMQLDPFLEDTFLFRMPIWVSVIKILTSNILK